MFEPLKLFADDESISIAIIEPFSKNDDKTKSPEVRDKSERTIPPESSTLEGILRLDGHHLKNPCQNY